MVEIVLFLCDLFWCFSVEAGSSPHFPGTVNGLQNLRERSQSYSSTELKPFYFPYDIKIYIETVAKPLVKRMQVLSSHLGSDPTKYRFLGDILVFPAIVTLSFKYISLNDKH